jgi:hypothetical protein
MIRFILDNVVLFVACAGSFVAGVLLSSQTLKDKISGVSTELRAALKAQEARAVQTINAAHAQATASVVKAVAPPMPPTPANPLAPTAAPASAVDPNAPKA